MKNLIYFFFGVWALASCAPAATTSTTTTTTTINNPVVVISPMGQWNYTITGTPQGDYAGLFTVTQNGLQFSAMIAVAGTDLPIQNFVFNPETKKMTGELSYMGLLIAFEAVMTTPDELTGAMAEGGMEFPFKATRRK